MPRTGRTILVNHPHHVIQRGHNRQVVFAEPRDFERYLETLAEFKQAYGVKVYAWCLMPNHVHLLVEPENLAGLGQLMKRLAGRQTRYRNRVDRRTGTLWESRYKSSPVENETYLLACARYIELNPVRAGIVSTPTDYQWSSCRYRLGHADCEWFNHDSYYLSLGASEAERRWRYGDYLRAAIPEAESALIRAAVQRGQLTGTERFVREVEAIIGRRIENRPPGRPVKSMRVSCELRI